MSLEYKTAESLIKPLEIDVTTCPSGVYVRRDIKEVQKEDSAGNTITSYEYKEAFLTKSEYEAYSKELIANTVNGIDNSTAYENYITKLDTPVTYSVNGFTYKPKWAESVYSGLLQKGALLPALFPLKIYDSTELEANAVTMTITELTALTVFLGGKQEEYFAEYKAEKTA